jgi:hypothetical protein
MQWLHYTEFIREDLSSGSILESLMEEINVEAELLTEVNNVEVKFWSF